jgi:hypothetical protein
MENSLNLEQSFLKIIKGGSYELVQNIVYFITENEINISDSTLDTCFQYTNNTFVLRHLRKLKTIKN